MTLSRDRSGRFADWWWTVDRVALFAMFGLIAIGLMLAFAASPAAISISRRSRLCLQRSPR
jgi:cell division protein FtsW (lipid II flippase)